MKQIKGPFPSQKSVHFFVEQIDCLKGSVFPKLNWSAPTDAIWLSPHKRLECNSADDVRYFICNRSRQRFFRSLCFSRAQIESLMTSLHLLEKKSPILRKSTISFRCRNFSIYRLNRSIVVSSKTKTSLEFLKETSVNISLN